MRTLEPSMEAPVYTILFLCTHNSARSILAEGLMNHLGRGRFRAYSAGSRPSGLINPHALATLRESGIDFHGMRSKSWDEFIGPHAPGMDFVITVCDNAANEPCPIWHADAVTAHWGCADPSAKIGSDETIREAFRETAALLVGRIRQMISLPLASLSGIQLHRRIGAIARS